MCRWGIITSALRYFPPSLIDGIWVETCISELMQTTFFYLGRYLKLADGQCSSITKDSVYLIKHNYIDTFNSPVQGLYKMDYIKSFVSPGNPTSAINATQLSRLHTLKHYSWYQFVVCRNPWILKMFKLWQLGRWYYLLDRGVIKI